MIWYSPVEKKPPQGLNVLCMNNGDFYVAMRLQNYWFSIPFADSKYAKWKPPQKWTPIDFCENYKGRMFFKAEGELLNIDEFEKKDPKEFKKLVKLLKDDFSKTNSRHKKTQ